MSAVETSIQDKDSLVAGNKGRVLLIQNLLALSWAIVLECFMFFSPMAGRGLLLPRSQVMYREGTVFSS